MSTFAFYIISQLEELFTDDVILKTAIFCRHNISPFLSGSWVSG